MAEKVRGEKAVAADGGSNPVLLTLSQVSDRTGISMPTLQRYKKNYQSRIPSTGKGRRQRYPEEALAVFEEIKQENVGKRGRPRKSASGAETTGGRRGGRRRKAVAAAPRKSVASRRGQGGRRSGGVSQDLLTLTQVSDKTGISYPTLVRYVKLHADRIPHEGKGRRRRFHPEAVEVFRRLREESPRGRRKGSAVAAVRGRGRATAAVDTGLSQRIKALEKSHDQLEKQVKALIKQLQRPITVTLRGGR
jgi:DNA-binding transcriptional MerR regulator